MTRSFFFPIGFTLPIPGTENGLEVSRQILSFQTSLILSLQTERKAVQIDACITDLRNDGFGPHHLVLRPMIHTWLMNISCLLKLE